MILKSDVSGASYGSRPGDSGKNGDARGRSRWFVHTAG
jgi:hypothetical protein